MYRNFGVVNFINGEAATLYVMRDNWDNLNAVSVANLPQGVYPIAYDDQNDGDRMYAFGYGSTRVVGQPSNVMMDFDILNAFRAIHGLTPLIWNDALANAAHAHSKDMHDNHYFSHTNLSGERPVDRARAAGYQGHVISENNGTGTGTGGSIGGLNGFINSPAHRGNLLGNWSEVGIGHYSSSNRRVFFTTQKFGRP
jgi:hypothetical protein